MTYFFDDWEIDILEYDAVRRPGVSFRADTLEEADAVIRRYEQPFIRAAEEAHHAELAKQREEKLQGPTGRCATTFEIYEENLRRTGRTI